MSQDMIFSFLNALAVICRMLLRTTSSGAHEVILVHIFANLLTLLWSSCSLAKQAYLPENTTEKTLGQGELLNYPASGHRYKDLSLIG